MLIAKKFNFASTFTAASFLLPAYLFAADSNTVTLTAEITKGSCSFSTTADSVVFTQRQVISDFSIGNAVAIMPFKLLYQCEGYNSGAQATISVSGQTSPDNRVFLSDNSTAAGVGFMLKNGTVTELNGFYNAGNTLINGNSFLVDAIALSEHTISIGFVKQNTPTNVTSGDVNAVVTFTLIIP